ncbi:VOC family protein [Paenibacillus mendelii]|uniref:VOC family protein n=1 Tax=Paenibacillus mendelii TaxID=206163 RepID=A0ABV6JB65_9BACL|nr:VOC family protein [Paenibacillus mendelii]MCQ6558492.1 VOC family protein [Paenibacillus mendelii]
MTYQFLGLDHVQLAAPAQVEEQARSFYSGILGMPEIKKPEKLISRGGVWFQCGIHQVHIGVQDNFVAAVKAHPAFQVERISELRSMLLQRGVEVRDDDARDGAERFYIDDPFGNRLEFIEWSSSYRKDPSI